MGLGWVFLFGLGILCLLWGFFSPPLNWDGLFSLTPPRNSSTTSALCAGVYNAQRSSGAAQSSAGFRIPHTGFVVKNKFPLAFFLYFKSKSVFSSQCSNQQGGGKERAQAQGAGERPVTVSDANGEPGREQSNAQPMAPQWVQLGAGHPKKGTIAPQPLWQPQELSPASARAVGTLLQREAGSKRVYCGRQ